MTTVSQSPSLNNDLPPSRRLSASPLSSSPTPTVAARSSHYRPFSTLYTESPSLDIQDKFSSLLKRHSSISGLQTFAHMGISFRDKAKANKNLSPVHLQVDQDQESSKKFIPKSIWAKRHNMKLHPYPQDGPYMQAYDPILLDR